MHPRRLLALLKPFTVLCAALALSAQSAPERLDYTLTPVMTQGALGAVQVDLRMRGDVDGETTLRLPDAWGGQPELWRAIEGISAVSGATLGAGEGPAQRVLRHRPGAQVHVRYRIVQDHDGPPNARLGNAYRAVVQPGYFHLIGEAAMVTPEDADAATPVRVRMRNLPRGWTFASDLEHDGLTLAQVWSSVTVAGDFRVLRGSDRNIRVAIRGQWGFSDESFLGEVNAIISGQRAFWRDDSSPFLVTVLPLDAPQQGWLSIGGTGLGDAFAFFATANAEQRAITRTLAHESLHTWIPYRIGGAPDEDEALHYWLSEGFTDFYTGRLLVRQGLWTPHDFAGDLNTMLHAYAVSSAREAANTRILAEFWSDSEVRQLPYQRGRLLATIWDAQLRTRASSLDGVMHAMRAHIGAGQSGPAAALFARTALEHGLDTGSDYAAFVEAGAAILLPEDVFAPCGRVVMREARLFHRGFDIAATAANENVITGVDPGLPAYAAGLRDGMVLLSREGGEIGNAELELSYRVRDGETERVIGYMPQAPGSVRMQQLELAADLEGDALAQCLSALGGG